jgi:hypothetical protein
MCLSFKSKLDYLPTELIIIVKDFLINKDIIELICISKEYNRLIGKKNVFTSFIFRGDTDFLMTSIRNYINNAKSIRKTTLYRVHDPQHIWPFESEMMIHHECSTDEIIEYSEKVRTICITHLKNNSYIVKIGICHKKRKIGH